MGLLCRDKISNRRKKWERMENKGKAGKGRE